MLQIIWFKMLQLSEKSWECDGIGVVTCLSLFGHKQWLGSSNWLISQPGIVWFSRFDLESCLMTVWHPGTQPNKPQLFSEHFSKIPCFGRTWSFSRILSLSCDRSVWNHLVLIFVIQKQHQTTSKSVKVLYFANLGYIGCLSAIMCNGSMHLMGNKQWQPCSEMFLRCAWIHSPYSLSWEITLSMQIKKKKQVGQHGCGKKYKKKQKGEGK